MLDPSARSTVDLSAVNLAFAALTISPVPTLDGAAILRALARRRNA